MVLKMVVKNISQRYTLSLTLQPSLFLYTRVRNIPQEERFQHQSQHLNQLILPFFQMSSFHFCIFSSSLYLLPLARSQLWDNDQHMKIYYGVRISLYLSTCLRQGVPDQCQWKRSKWCLIHSNYRFYFMTGVFIFSLRFSQAALFIVWVMPNKKKNFIALAAQQRHFITNTNDKHATELQKNIHNASILMLLHMDGGLDDNNHFLRHRFSKAAFQNCKHFHLLFRYFVTLV